MTKEMYKQLLHTRKREVDKMERNKYIKVIDYYNRLLTKGTITREMAWWKTQDVILCAMKDDGTTPDDFCYICEYRDRLF